MEQEFENVLGQGSFVLPNARCLRSLKVVYVR